MPGFRKDVAPELDEHLAQRENQALLAARLLQRLVRSRRYYLDEFMDGDGPYWTAMGLFIDEADDVDTRLERVVNFTDESIETSRYLLGQMIERQIVQRYNSNDGSPAFRLMPAFSAQFARYLQYQFGHVQRVCTRISERGIDAAPL